MNSTTMATNNTPHVLMFPLPIQGHMPPMLKLASLLLSSSSDSDLLITFVNTDHSHLRFSPNSPLFARLTQHPNFRFRTIPDALPADHPRHWLRFMDLLHSLTTNSREHYRKLLLDTRWPPVTCVVADAILSMAIDVAEEENIPAMVFRTSSACSLWVFHCIQHLIHTTKEVPFPKDADMDETVRGVEGMEGFLRRRDLPSFCRDATSPDDPWLEVMTAIARNAGRGKALIMNTFEELEAAELSRVRSFAPLIYTIGPIHLLGGNDRDNSVNLWREDRGCMQWLDSQDDKSVVYVSFGSVVFLSREEQVELWHGLVDSGHRFLWAMRKDLVLGEQELMAPPELEEGTREKGCMVSWAPQEEVLAHRAVGCFFTHSGWNSTMESIVAGMPMICWPFITDQNVNSRFTSEVWKIGLDLNKDKRDRRIIAETVKAAMEGEKAEELRRSVGEMAEKAKRSVKEGGDSYLNFQMLVQHIKSLK